MIKDFRKWYPLLLLLIVGGCDPNGYFFRYSMQPDIGYYARFGVHNTEDLASRLIRLTDSLAARYNLSDTSRSGQYTVKSYSRPAGLFSSHTLQVTLQEISGSYWISVDALSGAEKEKPKEILDAMSFEDNLCESLTRLFGTDSFTLYNRYRRFDFWNVKR